MNRSELPAWTQANSDDNDVELLLEQQEMTSDGGSRP